MAARHDSADRRPRRQALIVALALGPLCCICSPTIAAEGSTRRPNVIVILADDLGRADIGRRLIPGPESPLSPAPEGGLHRIHASESVDRVFEPGDFQIADPDTGAYAVTPHMDRLVERGIELTQYLSHPLCSPTRAGLLTGRHYVRVGSGPETGGTLSPEVSNLARDLQSAGYATAAFGKWHNGYPNFPADGNGAVVPNRNRTDPTNETFENYKGIPWGIGVNAYGFNEWLGFYGGATDYFNRYSSWDNDVNWWTDTRYTPRADGHTVDIVSAAVVDFMIRHRERPFFCWVAMPAPHEPLHVLRSDLKAVSEEFPGAWQRVRDLTSPTTGRRVGQVRELRCSEGEEFDHTILDPDGEFLLRLVHSALVFAMDRAVGEIVTAIETLGLSDDTIVWLTSDNGGNDVWNSRPYRSRKGSLYEGGIRVPAIVWWPGTFDALHPAYAASNHFPHLVQYLDLYPTTMAMVGLAPSASDLDGRAGWEALRRRVPMRPPEESAFISFNRTLAVARGENWKLLYNEAGSRQQVELYDIANDPLEKVNLADERPQILERLVGDLHHFMADHRLSMSYFPPQAPWAAAARPAPDGDVLEIRATQKQRIENGDIGGLFVRFASAGIGDYAIDQLDSGDLLSYDLFVAADSDRNSGFLVTPGRGVEPVFTSTSGVTPDGQLIASRSWPRERWVHIIAGIGEIAPLPQSVDYIALRSPFRGTYHFFIDNVRVLNADGSAKAVIWESRDDTLKLQFRFRGTTYLSWEEAVAAKGFPFSDLEIR